MNANIYIIVIFPLLFQDEQIKIWLVTMFPYSFLYNVTVIWCIFSIL